jgi:hypothetical protein
MQIQSSSINLGLALTLSFALHSLSASDAQADDRLNLRLMSRANPYAKVACIGDTDVSRSQLNKHTRIYNAFFTARQVKAIAKGRQYLDFKRVMTKIYLQAHGANATSHVVSAQISIELKTLRGQELSTMLVTWAHEDLEEVLARAESQPKLNVSVRPQVTCHAKGDTESAQVCRLDADLNQSANLNHLYRMIQLYHHKYPTQGLKLGLVYRSTTYTDCAGRLSVATARDMSSTPPVYLRDQ